MVVIDTSVVIDHIRQPRDQQTMLDTLSRRVPKSQLRLSVLSVQELYAGKSTREHKKEGYLVALIASLQTLPYSYAVAQLAGELVRDNVSPLTFADAGIAATAIVNGASLFTLNEKDFRGISGLQMFKAI